MVSQSRDRGSRRNAVEIERPGSRLLPGPKHRLRPVLEWLEDRVLLANFTVTNTGDAASSPPAGSLRNAIMMADGDTSNDTITFSVTGTITLAAQIAIQKNTGTLTIQGPGAKLLSISGYHYNGTSTKTNLFEIDYTTVNMSGLTLTDGTGTNGSAVDVIFSPSVNNVNDSFTNCTLAYCNSSRDGGAIYTGNSSPSSSVNINECTFDYNNCGGLGGAIDGTTGILNITGSTFYGHTSGLSGGAVDAHSTTTIYSSTFTANRAGLTDAYAGGGAIDNYSGASSVTVGNSILFGDSCPLAPEYSNQVSSAGHNLVSPTRGGSGWNPTDLTSQLLAADLGPFGDYGGPTMTVPLLPGSPAINAGVTGTNIPTTDQRGLPRFGAPDIGAFESQGFAIGVTSGSNQSANLGTSFASPLVATVRANNSVEPVAGGLVSFAVPLSGASASISGSPATIQADGTATVTASANLTQGAYSVAATGPNVSTPAVFNLANQKLSPTFSSLVSPIILYGTGTTTLTGHLGSGTTYPSGDRFTVTINSASMTAAVDSIGNFSVTFNTSNLGVSGSPYPVIYSFAGDATFNPSTDASTSLTVQTPTMTTLVSSSNPDSVSSPATLTATVAAVVPGSPIPQGTVDFYVGSSLVASAMVDAQGRASAAPLLLGHMGPQFIEATFVPSRPDYLASTSVAQQLIVVSGGLQLTASTTVPVVDQPVTFTATQATLPAGTANFYQITATGETLLASVATSNGVATFTQSFPSTGLYQIGVSFTLSGASAPLTYNVVPGGIIVSPQPPPTVVLQSSANPSVYGQWVIFTATVIPEYGGSPAGLVEFRDGSTILGTARVGIFEASLPVSTLWPGSHSIQAIFNGTGGVTTSQATQTFTVIPADSTTTLSVSTTSTTYGQTDQLTAMVVENSPATAIPTGYVIFSSGSTILGTAPLPSDGTATLTTAPTDLLAGGDVITVTFVDPSGSVLGSASSPTLISVSRSPLRVVTDNKSKVFGAPVPALSGTVTGVVPGDAITADFSTSATASSDVIPGGYPIVPVLMDPLGQLANYVVTIVPAILTITAEPTTLTLSGALAGQGSGSAIFGQPDQFTAVVSSRDSFGGTPSGSVQFFDGTLAIGTAPLIDGTAVLSTSLPGIGEQSVVARYVPTADYTATGGPASLVETIGTASTTIVIASSLTSTTKGQTIFFEATVRPVAPSTGVPDGSVQFLVDKFAFGSPVPLNAAGVAVSSTNQLSVGVHTITAFYLGNANYSRSPMATGTISILSTVAGTGVAGFGGDGGPAPQATFNQPTGVAIDSQKNIYIADTSNNRIRMISPSGTITTVVGTGAVGDSGDGGPAGQAQLNHPTAISIDLQGNLFIADTGNNAIREVTRSGIISTILGSKGLGLPNVLMSLNAPLGVVVDRAGLHLFVSDTGNNQVLEVMQIGPILTAEQFNGVIPAMVVPVAGTGAAGLGVGPDGLAVHARLDQPSGLALDLSGNLYIADSANNLVQKVIQTTGMIVTVAGKVGETNNNDGGKATEAALHNPTAVAVDPVSGLVYISDTGADQIRYVQPDGIINSIYSGNTSEATFQNPTGIANGPQGDVYIANTTANNILSIANLLPEGNGSTGGSQSAGIEIFVGAASATVSTSTSSTQLNSQLVPLNESSLSLLAAVFISVGVSFEEPSISGPEVAPPNQPPSSVNVVLLTGEVENLDAPTQGETPSTSGEPYMQNLIGPGLLEIEPASSASTTTAPSSTEEGEQGRAAASSVPDRPATIDEAIRLLTLEKPQPTENRSSSLRERDPLDDSIPGRRPAVAIIVPLGVLAATLSHQGFGKGPRDLARRARSQSRSPKGIRNSS